MNRLPDSPAFPLDNAVDVFRAHEAANVIKKLVDRRFPPRLPQLVLTHSPQTTRIRDDEPVMKEPNLHPLGQGMRGQVPMHEGTGMFPKAHSVSAMAGTPPDDLLTSIDVESPPRARRCERTPSNSSGDHDIHQLYVMCL